MDTVVRVAGANQTLVGRRQRAVARGVASAYGVFAERAGGARLWDVEGREYVDFAAGIGTLNLGHTHPEVGRAIAEQADRFLHTCFQVVQYESYVALAERLNRLVPGDFPKKTLLLSTGAEATENAIKIARVATGRPGVVAFRWGYHGRTLLALTMTGKQAPYRQAFGPWAPDVYHAQYPYALHGWDTQRALAALHELFETEASPQRIAAFIIEPVLGEGGFVPAPPEFMRALRALADKHGILLIADEVQTGFGRTGTMFAMEHSGVAADLTTIAKSLAGGLPLSAVVGRAESWTRSNRAASAARSPAIPSRARRRSPPRAFESDDVSAARARSARRVRARLYALALRFAADVAEVRGLGAMVAIEFRDSRPTSAAATCPSDRRRGARARAASF